MAEQSKKRRGRRLKKTTASKAVTTPSAPTTLAEAVRALKSPDLGHDELASLGLQILADDNLTGTAKVKALELLLKIKQDRRAEDGPAANDPGSVLMAAIMSVKKEGS